jgi:hypothetical protein
MLLNIFMVISYQRGIQICTSVIDSYILNIAQNSTTIKNKDHDMFKLTRKAKKIQSLMNAVSIRNARPIILQSIKAPHQIPAMIVFDELGFNLADIDVFATR